MEQIDRNGLDAFTDRPGDVLDFAEYWRSFNRFGSFADMVEHGVTTKLREIESYRGDSDVLSPAKAREGAERIAAALIFGKSFTLRAPDQDPDPSLASGAIDPALVLDADSGGSRPVFRDDLAHHSDLISLGIPR
jgi:hypothetical protein